MPSKNENGGNIALESDDEYQQWLRFLGKMFRYQSGQIIADMASRMVRTISYQESVPRRMMSGEFITSLSRMKQAFDRIPLDAHNVLMGGPKWCGGKDKYGNDIRK